MGNFSLLLLPILLFTSNALLTLNETSENKEISTYSNTDTTLGIFRDYSSEEIKNYYIDLADDKGIKGDELLDNLQPILANNHKKISHSAAWDSSWNYFLLLDRDYELDPLSDEEISNQKWKTDNVVVRPIYTDIQTWIKSETRYFDREHMWPKSRGFKDKYDTSETLSEQPYAATDMHNLRMGERTNNQQGHNNYPYGEVVDKNASTTIKIVDTYTNEVTGYRGLNINGYTVYEPRDEDKGDIARALFYMATRYHNYIDTETFQPSLKLVSEFDDDYNATITCDSTKEKSATYGILSDLLKWHIEDPVSDFERHRNNLCYTIVQNNRNPYIDYPEWALVAFGDADYGINLDSDIGVDKEGISISINIEQLEIDDILLGENIKITYIDENNIEQTITLDDPNLSITITHNGQEETFDGEYTFIEQGEYIIEAKYTIGDTTYIATKTITITDNNAPTTFFDDYKYYIYIGAVALFIIIVVAIISGAMSKKKRRKKRRK